MKRSQKETLLAITLAGLAIASPVSAANNKNFNSERDFKKASISATPKLNRLENLENRIATKVSDLKKNITSRVFLTNAKVTAVSANSLTVTDSAGKSITVNVDNNSRLRRRYFGTATISEISVNDLVNVFGKWTDDAHTTVQAQQIRDVSIQKRFGVFVGDVTAVSGNSITLKSVNRGTQNVTVSGTTKFVDRRNKAIVQTDVIVGHRIRVKGMWDNTNNTITEVTQVKDYNLPVRPTLKPTPTPAATPNPTVAPTATPTP